VAVNRRGREPARKVLSGACDEAFKDLLKKHHQPVGLKAALKESVGAHGKARYSKS
jgi:hypothetical protein